MSALVDITYKIYLFEARCNKFVHFVNLSLDISAKKKALGVHVIVMYVIHTTNGYSYDNDFAPSPPSGISPGVSLLFCKFHSLRMAIQVFFIIVVIMAKCSARTDELFEFLYDQVNEFLVRIFRVISNSCVNRIMLNKK